LDLPFSSSDRKTVVVTGDGLKTFDLNELIAKWNEGGQALGPDLMKVNFWQPYL
jgi:hypothetical protein